MIRRIALAVVVVTAGLAAGISAASAQGASCSAFQSTCAERCRVRAPQDVNCVSDHCTPKLAACRRSGCWQEGRMYGGKKTCNLTKS